MKVILQGYYTCCQNKSKRINAFKTRLANQSIDVELFNPFETKLEDADIIHFFMPGISVSKEVDSGAVDILKQLNSNGQVYCTSN